MSTRSRMAVGPYIRELLAGSSGRRTNVLLLILVLAATGTGALIFALGSRWAAVAVGLHAVMSFGMLVVTRPKWRIVRHGMRTRPGTSTWPSVLLGALIVATLVTGVLHSAGLVLRYGPLRGMQVHVGAAIAALLLTAWHVAARGNVPQRRDLSRRNLLRVGLVLGAAGGLLATLEGGYRLLGLPGGRRRFTGSHEEGSFRPEAMPSIIWLFDPRPTVAAAHWRLEVTDGRGVRRYTYDDLALFHDRMTATIDCTVGWYADQHWHGVRLSRLVDVPAEARSVLVRSVTGYWRLLPLDDLPHLLLATGYGGQPLEQRHGYPLRLVAPGRRGFWWVKWVERVEVTARPWWSQPYFPVQ